MATEERYDTLLTGGLVLDGTGGEGIHADVAFADGRIAAIGDLSRAKAGCVIDVFGLVVAPGFIDVHTHDDLACLRDPAMTPKLSQGVTTVIVGNCGLSAVPLRFEAGVPEPFNLLGGPAEFRYDDVADFAARIDAVRPSVNVAALVGHSSLRLRCVADLARRAAPDELHDMAALLQGCMDAGALGLSSGLFYSPAYAADIDELAPLAAIVARSGGVYTAHIRDERDGILDALGEFFAVSDDRRLPLIVSHHKCAGPANWGRSTETLALIDRARLTRPVLMDCYPYTAGSTILRPDLADGEVDILLNWSEPYPEMAGRTLRVIAANWSCSEPEAATRLAPGGASYFQMHEDDVRAILAHEACMIGSDGLPSDPLPHPRLWGTFPRVLGHYARDNALMPLATAVHRMTALSAATFNLGDRGVLRVGAMADVTVFNAEQITDLATYEQPLQAAQGIEHVFVGGTLSWTGGAATGSRQGRFVRRSHQLSDSKSAEARSA